MIIQAVLSWRPHSDFILGPWDVLSISMRLACIHSFCYCSSGSVHSFGAVLGVFSSLPSSVNCIAQCR